MARNRHPNKEIEEALEYAESLGWRVETCSGHAWGQVLCPHNDKECRCGEFCRMSVWSTPKNAGNHARKLKVKIDNCIYAARADDGEEGDR